MDHLNGEDEGRNFLSSPWVRLDVPHSSPHALSTCLSISAGFFADRALESLVPPDVDKEAFHLLKSLLDMNTRHRLTAQQAVEHAFLSDCPRLPIAAADSSIELADDDAPDFR